MRRSGAGRFRGAVLGLRRRRLRRLPLLDLCVVMPNHATDRRARHGMMARHVTHNTADSGAFQTTAGTAHARQQSNRCGNGSSQQYFVHVDSLM